MKDNFSDVTVAGIPEIYCSLSVFFDEKINITHIAEELCEIGIKDIRVTKPKYGAVNCVDLAVVQSEYSWELDNPLSKMFSQTETALQEIKRIIDSYSGDPFIDIAIYQHGSYPALVFSGDNMKKIHYLDANISIDLL